MHINDQVAVAASSGKFANLVAIWIATVALISVNVGCSLEASIESLSQPIRELSQKTVAEVTPGSEQDKETVLLKRKVQASISYESYEGASSKGKTTQGHTIYTNIQGSLFKE